MNTGPTPKWMLPPEQPAAGTDAATASPASPAPKPNGPAAPAPSPLQVRSHLDGIVEPAAIKAAAAVEDQRAQDLADEFDGPPAKSAGYRLNTVPVPRDSGVEPMSPATAIAVGESLRTHGVGVGLGQSFVAADYLARAPTAPLGEAALAASSSAAMDKWAKEIEHRTGAKYDDARTEAENRAIAIDNVMLGDGVGDLMIRDTSGTELRVRDWWQARDVRNNVALLKKIDALIARAKQGAARTN